MPHRNNYSKFKKFQKNKCYALENIDEYAFIYLVPSYKKRRDTFKRTKTTGIIQNSNIPSGGRKAAKGQFSSITTGRQDTATSFSSSYQDQQQCPLAQSDGMYGRPRLYYLLIRSNITPTYYNIFTIWIWLFQSKAKNLWKDR